MTAVTAMTVTRTLGAAALCLILAWSNSVRAAEEARDVLKAGDMAPLIVGKTAAGDPVDISQYRGKVVVVSFWATWCAYCIKELPVLENIQKAAGGHAQVLAVNTEHWEVFRKVRRGLKDLTMGLLYDPGEVGQKAYGVNSYPHMIIIGRDGRIHRVYRGYSEDSLDLITSDLNAVLQAPVTEAASAGGLARAEAPASNGAAN